MIDLIKSIFYPKLKLGVDEQQIKEVIELLLNHPQTKYQVAPLSRELIILNRELDYFVLIGRHIKLSNHTFILEKHFRLNFVESIKELVENKIEEDRQALIKELFENEITMLKNIKNNLIA